jgi:opacity protein-like surface antigen
MACLVSGHAIDTFDIRHCHADRSLLNYFYFQVFTEKSFLARHLPIRKAGRTNRNTPKVNGSINRRETDMKSERSLIKQAAISFIVPVLLLSLSAAAQEMRSEISVQGTGSFTKDSNGNGVQNKATNTGGFLLGYRYNVNRRLSAEVNYGYDRNTQLYSGLLPGRVQANVHQFTGSAVVKLPGYRRVLPYVLGGGGGLLFDPTNNAGGALVGATQQTKGAFLYGGGADYVFTNRLLLRAEYRGFVYQAPDFNVANLHTGSWTHLAQPSAGFVYRF